MATYYAWSNFQGADENSRPTKLASFGDKVDAKTLGVNDTEFAAYVESGAVRTVKPPDMSNFGGSPRELRLLQLQAASAAEEYAALAGNVPVFEEDEATPSK